ncbi:CLUMA_CG002926, isoform A [Clunio marinus]|uniref:CLUMA_CG002926, isoform A n=1 Tax=Clunio marinus TaxID=568069 RepID=A0A1J1HM97_9DIPT|nr:CLUMA_CG002926, isoform A [Clunio marinus]
MGSVALEIQNSTIIRQSSSHGRQLLALLLFVLLTTQANGFCPSKCICDGDTNNLKAKCINAGLDVVPIQLNPNVKHINLTDNKIATVHFTLSFYYELETLDISGNTLESLGMKNFVAQEKLRKLYLQKNVIKKLSKDTFRGMRQLEVLDLSYNQIAEMDPQCFSDLTRLSFLDLTNNSVISVDGGVFQNLLSLETLLFTSNQLLSVPYNENFEYLRKLRRLDLSGNLIKQIENNSFQHMSQLQTLHLNGNLINGIDVLAFDGLMQLQYLDLSDNNLTSVPTDQLSKLSNLTHLSLNGNFIQTLPAVSFLNLFQLRELHMDRLVNLVKIDSRAFIDNVNLQILTMNDNEQFSDLPVHLFHGNLNLIELSIKNNKLYQLDAIQLPLDQLKKLSLADNPFVCNCSLIWLWQLIKSSSVTSSLRSSQQHSNDLGGSSLAMDKENIGCDIVIKNDDDQVKVIRKKLTEMSEADIKCPTHIVTIISVILTVIFIAIICISILIVIKCSRTAHLKRRQQKYLSGERQNIGELIIPQKIDKYELERYLADQQLQHQQKQQQIQQQYQMNHHTIQPIHSNQNQYFQHPNPLIKPNEYRSLKKWENGDITQQYPTLNSHQTLKASTTPTITSSSPLKKLQKNNIHILNNYNHTNSLSLSRDQDDEPLGLSQEQIYSKHPDDDESNFEEDHYENFDDNYLNSLNRKINIQSTLPLTKAPTTTTTLFNTNESNKKSLHNNIKPHIVYV